ncbi:MAG: XkdQ/YqbQ family protein [Candidatus Heteroscillospira sp.]|jgi:hypothetical protein
MSTGNSFTLALVTSGGEAARDITPLVHSLSWSGSARQTARELSGALAIPREGGVEIPLEEGAQLALTSPAGQLFVGPLVSVASSSLSSTVDFAALDRGRFLVGNEGWYSFSEVTPEAACAAIAADFGIPVGGLVKTGVRVSRKFPGTALDSIITSLYALAGEKNGKRYHIRFDGTGRLEAAERPAEAAFEISRPMSVTNTWDITELQNSVAIYTDDGQLVRRIQDSQGVERNGRLEHVLTQKNGEDAEESARAWLEDHGLSQSLTAELFPGNTELRTGGAVRLRDAGSGVSGLFWIESDTHTWKNGLLFTKLGLSFRQLAQDKTAGEEIS